jgi:DNA-binding response OmpR family regulator
LYIDEIMLIDRTLRATRITALARRVALIVEDDPRVQRSMSKQLWRAGFQVLSALHYDAAVLHLANRKPHVVCVDVGLPAKSGYELCEYIRGPLGLTLVPIIVTSEYGHSEDMAFAEAVGANAFLRKPFSSQQLTDCVESLLNRTPGSAPPAHELERFAADGTAGVQPRSHVHPAQAVAARLSRRPRAAATATRAPAGPRWWASSP